IISRDVQNDKNIGTGVSLYGRRIASGSFMDDDKALNAGAAYAHELQNLTTIENVIAQTANGSYSVGQTIVFDLVFSRNITVGGGPLMIMMNTGALASCSFLATNTLRCTYTIGAGESTADLDFADFDSLLFNGATVTDSLGNVVSLNLPRPGVGDDEDSLGDISNIVVIDPGCNISFVSDAASLSLSIAVSGGSNRTWNMNGTIYNNVNTVNHNHGSAGDRNHTFRIEDGTHLEQVNFSGFQGIKSINFVGTCSALEQLRLQGNKLSAIDLSNLPDLKILYLADVYGIGEGAQNNKITSLDFSNNPLLELADISYNLLPTIDVSGMVNLHTLRARTNNFTSVNLSGATALKQLWLVDPTGPGFTSIDMSTNLLLEDVQLIKVGLTTLDIDNNTLLKSLNVSGNDLTAIDISQNTILETLYLANRGMGGPAWNTNRITTLDTSNNPVLKTLEITDNLMTTMNLTPNPQLITFTAYNVPLTSLNLTGLTALQTVAMDSANMATLDLSTNTALVTLNARDCGFTNINLTNNTLLRYVTLDGNLLTGNFDTSTLSVLETLHLGNSGAGAPFNTNLVTSLDTSNNPILKNLRIDYNPISTLDLTPNPQLLSFYAHQVPITSIDITGLNQMTFFYLSDGNISNIDFSTNTALTDLRVIHSGLTSINVNNNTLLQNLYVPGNLFSGAFDTSTLTQLRDLTLGIYGSGSCAGWNTNRVTSLNLTNNTLIRNIYIDCNLITTLDVSNKNQLIRVQSDNNPLDTLVLANNTALNYFWLRTIGDMGAVLDDIYNARATLPVATMSLIGNGIPSAPEQAQIDDLETNYSWTITHD
ncbi:MAG: hypothetical protein JNM93_10965, partial [Bacteriovoracaceae bacterium]|nr:hypothetical protein [Bacteriovoracaceae bacterium]